MAVGENDALDQFLTGFNPLPWNADAGAQPVAQQLDADAMAGGVWPEDFSVLANWFAGINNDGEQGDGYG